MFALEIFYSSRARRKRRGQPKNKVRDRGSALTIFAGLYIILFISFGFSINRLGVLPGWMKDIGYLLMIIGMAFRFSAIHQLGRFFSPVVRIVENQEIVQTGLYKWIRHPAYTGGWITVVGIGLGLGTWWGALLCAIGMWIIYAYRIGVEEKVLRQYFGTRYIMYSKTTWRMFPGIW